MKTKLVLSLMAIVLVTSLQQSHGQTTVFTYQGRLDDGGSPANGRYDMTFALYDADAAGSQQGNTITNSAVSVSGGRFSVALDFGDQFPGSDRWLEIGVRTNGSGPFSTLSPRQQLTSTPYALRAANAANAISADSVSAGNITGTLSPTQLPPSIVTNGANGVNLGGSFSGNGSGLTGLNASQLASGTVPDARLSANVALLNAGNIFTGANVFADKIGIGGGAPNFPLSFSPAAGDKISLWGGLASSHYGFGIQGNLLQIHTDASASDIAFGYGGSTNLTETVRFKGNGNVGIGIADPATRLHVAGTVTATGFVGPIDASNLTGTLPLQPLPPGVLTNGASGVNLYGSFSGSGAGMTNIASSVLTGPLTVDAIQGTLLGGAYDGGTARGLEVVGNYAYVANSGAGLRIYDVSGPGDPVSVGQTNNGGSALGVTVAGSYAYLANSTVGLRIYSNINPANPQNVGHATVTGDVQGVAVSGNYAYIASGGGGLQIYSVANQASPILTGQTNDGGFARGVAVSGNYAYLANDTDNLRVYFIGNPANPVNVAHWDGSGESFSVAVSGHYAYLANRFDGVRIFDITNPTNLIPVGNIPALGAGNARSVSVSGNYAYVGLAPLGLGVYDISNPFSPIEVGHFDVVGGEVGWAAVALGDRIAFACGNGGLKIVSLGVVHAPSFASLGSISIAGQNALELGEGLAGKEQNAGKILYQGLSDGLDIVGAGTNVASRRISFYNEGGATFSGPLSGTSANFSGAVVGGSFSGNGAGLTNLNIPSVADAQLSANVALLNRSAQSFAGQNTFAGSVGIGTAVPQAPLHVATLASLAGIIQSSSTIGTWAALQNTSTGGTAWQFISTGSGNGEGAGKLLLGWKSTPGALDGTVMTLVKNGHVGMGVSDPGLNTLQINPWFHSANGYGLQVNRADYGANIQINRTGGQGGIGLVVDNSANGDSTTSLLLVRNNVGSSADTVMNVRADGRTLVKELEITGGADVSEPFNIASGLAPKPGMVVVIDSEKVGELRVCTEAYDRSVAGIISGANGIRPGLVLKQKDSAADGEHPVALSGRVWCYCDASKAGAIRPGDLLTSSDTPGHAMKATDRERAFGAILGKAMSSLDSGTGMVLVLVRPQ